MTTNTVVNAATCLGCGCTCDDIDVLVSNAQIVEARTSCALGRQWFGSGAAFARATINGQQVSIDDARRQAVILLSRASAPQVLLASDVSCETYREAVACADLLRARLDVFAAASVTSATLAMQERGIATATLGEIRNRADAIVFWGVDPTTEFPRFQSRYAPDPIGLYCPDGRQSRTVVAVDVGDRQGPSDADLRVYVAPEHESDTLIALAAAIGQITNNSPEPHAHHSAASTLATHLRDRRYVALVADPTASVIQHDRLHRLLALSHALNVHGRGAICMLRHGGNQSGAEAVVTRQTGYPGAVDFASGMPRYRPHTDPAHAACDCLLIVGAPGGIAMTGLAAAGRSVVAIGPGATDSAFAAAGVMIDSATAGIHTSGTAVRMDDVPVSLTAVVQGPPDATMLCQDLLRDLQRERH